MARKYTIECDICGKPDAEEWIIAVDGHKWRLDLCREEHGAMLRKWGEECGEKDPPPASTSSMNTKRYERFVRGVPDPDPKG